jgi:tetratricopeptide (TPR) repeat protein
MIGKNVYLSFIAPLSLLATAFMTHAASADFTYPTDRACTPSESWQFSSAFPDESQREFRAFLSKGKKSIRGFSEAIALRKITKVPEEKLFAEYWMAHALLDAGQVHVAYQGFLAIASRPAEQASVAIHVAALDCLVQIHYLHSSLPVPAQAGTNIASYKNVDGAPQAMNSYLNQVVWDAQTNLIQTALSDDRVTPAAIQSSISVLSGGGPYLALSQGLWMAKQGEHFKTIENLEKFVNEPKLPKNLGRFIDLSHLLLARAHYSVGQFDLASEELKRIHKNSNFLAETLQELSWAYLLNERYPEAIGTAMNLEAGGIRHTYAPEAPMVMAMAMNELCQYPESVKAIHTFRKNYESSYRWLNNWLNAGGANASKLYETSVDFIKRKPVNVPERVASEWVRSPLFIASQDEINMYFDERDATPRLGKSAASEQRQMGQDILKKARELKPQLKIAKMKLKPGQTIPAYLVKDLADLKDEVVHWRRMQLAAPVWSVVSKNFLAGVPTHEGKLIAKINAEIKTKNLRMMTQLEEIAENIQLIEVEIYNGASEDIIWQNAHPDYKDVAKQFKADQGLAPDQVWNWGRSLANENADENPDTSQGPEIWEDELGSFKANLFDNCSSKDKYLSLRIRRKSS